MLPALGVTKEHTRKRWRSVQNPTNKFWYVCKWLSFRRANFRNPGNTWLAWRAEKGRKQHAQQTRQSIEKVVKKKKKNIPGRLLRIKLVSEKKKRRRNTLCLFTWIQILRVANKSPKHIKTRNCLILSRPSTRSVRTWRLRWADWIESVDWTDRGAKVLCPVSISRREPLMAAQAHHTFSPVV